MSAVRISRAYVAAGAARYAPRDGRAATDGRLHVRRGPLRDLRAARDLWLLPLHALSAPDGHRGVSVGAHRSRLADRPLRRGAHPLLGSAGRFLEGILLRLRLRALEPEPGGS